MLTNVVEEEIPIGELEAAQNATSNRFVFNFEDSVRQMEQVTTCRKEKKELFIAMAAILY